MVRIVERHTEPRPFCTDVFAVLGHRKLRTARGKEPSNHPEEKLRSWKSRGTRTAVVEDSELKLNLDRMQESSQHTFAPKISPIEYPDFSASGGHAFVLLGDTRSIAARCNLTGCNLRDTCVGPLARKPPAL
jgi:hypothetical protein